MQAQTSAARRKYDNHPNQALIGECVEIARRFNVGGEARWIMKEIGDVDQVSRSAKRRAEYLEAFTKLAIARSREHCRTMPVITLRWVLAAWLRQAFNLDILDREGLLKHFSAATHCASLEEALAEHGPAGVFDYIARYIETETGA
jgi:hypothetical protein